MNRFRTLFVTMLALALAPVVTCDAGTILTTDTGYSGPLLYLGSFANGSYNYTFGPVSLPGGITFTSNAVDSNSGQGSVLGQGLYSLDANGTVFRAVYAGLDSGHGYMTFVFASPVEEFGAFMNYSPFPTNDDPVISAFDSFGNLLDSFDLEVTAPIVTPNASDQFMFRGISEDTALISSFRLAGSYLVATGSSNGVPIVPEPSSLAVFVLGIATCGFLRCFR